MICPSKFLHSVGLFQDSFGLDDEGKDGGHSHEHQKHADYDEDGAYSHNHERNAAGSAKLGCPVKFSRGLWLI